MEDTTTYALLSFLLALLLAIAIKFFFTSKHQSKKLPPGSLGWPLAGETFQWIGAAKKGDLTSFVYDRMRRYNPRIFKTSFLGHPTAVFCGIAGNKFLYSNENKLVSGTWTDSIQKLMPDTIMTKTGDDYARLRAHLMGFLRADALQRYVGRMDALTRAFLRNQWEGKDQLTVLPSTEVYALSIACALFVSIEDMERAKGIADKFRVVLEGMFQLAIAVPGTRFWKACKAADAIKKELTAVVTERKAELAEGKASPEDDLLSHLLMARDVNGLPLPEKDIVNNIFVLLLGAEDTLSIVLTFIMKFLAENPDVNQKVLEEQREIAMAKGPDELLTWEDVKKMKYSWNVAREALRIWSPGQGGLRVAIADIHYDGFHIPKGWKLFWNTCTTHQNPEYFPEPEKFEPSRFDGDGPVPYSFVPFGGGLRMCPGSEYARLEILIFMHNVVRKLRWELVLPEEKVTIDPLPAPAKGLPVRLFPLEDSLI